MSLRFEAMGLPDVVRITPELHEDGRGAFLETHHAPKYRAGGIAAHFVQDNQSRSVRGTLRGLHAQSPNPQGKLVRVIEGEIFDVAVDIRRGSPSYGKHVGTLLSGENHQQLYMPPGLAHGFVVISESALVEYKCSEVYRPECEFTLAWNDPDLAIPWPVETPLLSPRDAAAPPLRELQDRLIDFRD